jgi:hypothetical protein
MSDDYDDMSIVNEEPMFRVYWFCRRKRLWLKTRCDHWLCRRSNWFPKYRQAPGRGRA